ncbi:hypothetical protein PWP93_30695 [Paraburkholderia sp. A1RI-2L]|uniref:hypothetical protein n=1 Tax=Paraburkholderia sp. A1RI-2L TaxID=3028367 RepID=UPI003B76B589
MVETLAIPVIRNQIIWRQIMAYFSLGLLTLLLALYGISEVAAESGRYADSRVSKLAKPVTRKRINTF